MQGHAHDLVDAPPGLCEAVVNLQDGEDPVSGSGSSVMSSEGKSGAIQAARINMQNEAADKGANYVRIETAQGSVGLEMGTAFNCS